MVGDASVCRYVTPVYFLYVLMCMSYFSVSVSIICVCVLMNTKPADKPETNVQCIGLQVKQITNCQEKYLCIQQGQPK